MMARHGRGHIEHVTKWAEHGKNAITHHTAYLDGKVVGEWCIFGTSWAGKRRGASVARYRDWLNAVASIPDWYGEGTDATAAIRSIGREGK